jgi:exopolysaccharide biosynthesis polyprenyl glycosylphosphotransferase
MTILSVAREKTTTTTAAPSRALRALPATALAGDLVVVTTVGLVAAIGRERLDLFDKSARVVDSLGLAAPLIVVGWLVAIAVFGGYRRHIFGAGSDEFKSVVNASFVAMGLVGIGCYLARFTLSRGFFLIAFAIGIPALVLGRFLLRRALHTARRRGSLQQRVLIAGSPAHIDEIASVLRREPWLGYHVVGALTPSWDVSEETAFGIPVLGNADEATSVVEHSGVDVIFFAGGATGSAGQMRRMVWDLEQHQHVHVVVAPSVSEISGDRIRVRPVGGLPLMHIDPPTAIDASRWGKRLFDIVGSLSVLIAIAPLLVLISLRIKRNDSGPVLFRQTRIGRDGQQFSCLKFRTMVTDAEQILLQLHAEQGYEDGLFKMRDDPRVTVPGRWLRRYSLDELPQLINVLRGEMSLVGPRPLVPDEDSQIKGWHRRRLQLTPGMTGPWQVLGSTRIPLREMVSIDYLYVANWSLWEDAKILLRTVAHVLGRRGI